MLFSIFSSLSFVVALFFSGFALALTPEEVLESSDKNISSPMVYIKRVSINDGKLTMVSKIYTKDGKVFSKSLFPPKYVGNKFIFDEGQLLYYMGRSDRLIRMPRYVMTIPWMNNVIYMEDMSLVDFLALYKPLSMSSEKKDGYDTYVIELENVGSSSYFYKRKVWIDKVSELPIYQEVYDKDGNFLKTISAKQIVKVGEYYYIKHSRHASPDGSKFVDYYIDSIKFDATISDGLFSKMSLT